MMNALRLTEGFALSLFEERAGVPLVSALKELDQAERRGLIVRDHARVMPTELGRRFLNDCSRYSCGDSVAPGANVFARRHSQEPVATAPSSTAKSAAAELTMARTPGRKTCGAPNFGGENP